jgi:hypothetical protein
MAYSDPALNGLSHKAVIWKVIRGDTNRTYAVKSFNFSLSVPVWLPYIKNTYSPFVKDVLWKFLYLALFKTTVNALKNQLWIQILTLIECILSRTNAANISLTVTSSPRTKNRLRFQWNLQMKLNLSVENQTVRIKQRLVKASLIIFNSCHFIEYGKFVFTQYFTLWIAPEVRFTSPYQQMQN